MVTKFVCSPKKDMIKKVTLSVEEANLTVEYLKFFILADTNESILRFVKSEDYEIFRDGKKISMFNVIQNFLKIFDIPDEISNIIRKNYPYFPHQFYDLIKDLLYNIDKCNLVVEISDV